MCFRKSEVDSTLNSDIDWEKLEQSLENQEIVSDPEKGILLNGPYSQCTSKSEELDGAALSRVATFIDLGAGQEDQIAMSRKAIFNDKLGPTRYDFVLKAKDMDPIKASFLIGKYCGGGGVPTEEEIRSLTADRPEPPETRI